MSTDYARPIEPGDEFVRAIGNGTRRTNGEAIADLASLGYLPGRVLDPTFGRGKFWTHWRPLELVASDLYPHPERDTFVACATADFRDLPHDDGSFDTVTLDGPYKLNGTSTKQGPSAADTRYGVEFYESWRDRHNAINAGIVEALRVLRHGGYLLVKCQDQVCGLHYRWQTREFADVAEANGGRLVDRYLVPGYRKQPAETQRRVHADYSTFLIVRKGKR